MLSVFTANHVPLVHPGDRLAPMILDSLSDEDFLLENGDIVVVAQKIVSLSENRQVLLEDVIVSPDAVELAVETGKDPRIVEIILQESDSIIRKKPGLIIARHWLGLVGANAGIDQSNIDHSRGESALLLPEDPDTSAKLLCNELQDICGKEIGVIISDSVNRPWRMGSIGIAIGSSAIQVLDDRIGSKDLFGRTLSHTIINRADAIAAAAVLMMGESAERKPFAVVRGSMSEQSTQCARDAVRPVAEDLFL